MFSSHAIDARQVYEVHRAAWDRKPLLRQCYTDFFEQIGANRSCVPGVDIELGAGQGCYKQFRPQTRACDVVPCPWLDFAADASQLPIAPGTAANIIMIDVLHHLSQPAGFFEDAAKTLAPGGRLIMVEPFVSAFSWPVYRFIHQECMDTGVQPLASGNGQCLLPDDDPWSGNNAIPKLIFWRHYDLFRRRFPTLRIIVRRPFAILMYPLTGGFESRSLLPRWSAPVVRAVERLLQPLARWLAFRCLIVLERVE